MSLVNELPQLHQTQAKSRRGNLIGFLFFEKYKVSTIRTLVFFSINFDFIGRTSTKTKINSYDVIGILTKGNDIKKMALVYRPVNVRFD